MKGLDDMYNDYENDITEYLEKLVYITDFLKDKKKFKKERKKIKKMHKAFEEK